MPSNEFDKGRADRDGRRTLFMGQVVFIVVILFVMAGCAVSCGG